ncbi:MAG: helix-turn-helix transcriptional regulator [Candidatus Melainabacteria bacterium]|nr:helix-turn-helix transcriptional regulator [Candidatus Melainabacteria bacterium]
MNDMFSALQKARSDKGLTQTDLAQQLQLGQSYLSQLERGKHDIRVKTLSEWARVLDLEVMLVPRQKVPAVSFMIRHESSDFEELPPAYGPLPDEV